MATILLHKHHISGNITDRYAIVVYSFEFQNTRSSKDKSDELKFELTIDPHAFISSFKANIDGELFIGKTKEKEKASKQYYEAKQKNENAVLISQPYHNIPHVFEIKTNIGAQSNVSLNITIEQYLQKRFNYNQLDVQILRNFTKYNIKHNYKHISFELNIFDGSGIDDVQITNSVEMRKSVEGILINTNKNENNIIIEDNSMDELNKRCILIGNIDSKSSINELSLKYKLKGEQNASHILFDTKSHTFCHIISDIITHSMINQLQDNTSNEGHNILIPRRVVFVIDRSGSMRGMKWKNTVHATIEALKQLNASYDRYNILLFDKKINLFSEKGIIKVTRENIANSIQYLQNINVGKGTNINDALLTAVAFIRNDIKSMRSESNFYLNQIVFITDGKPFNGERNTHKITLNVKNANNLNDIDQYNKKISIFSFGVGKDENDSRWIHDLNHSFLKILSLNNNGFYKRIKQTTAAYALNEYFNVLSKPILMNVNIEYRNKNIHYLTQTSFNSFYSGNDIIICGQIADIQTNKDYELQLTITAITATQAVEKDDKIRVIEAIIVCKDITLMIYPQEYTYNANIERIWAYLTLQDFVTKQLIHTDMIQIDDDDKKQNTDEISPLSLALKYHFVTPWSSMIVVKETKHKQMDEYKQNDEANISQKRDATHSESEPPLWAKRMKKTVSKTHSRHSNVRSNKNAGYKYKPRYSYESTKHKEQKMIMRCSTTALSRAIPDKKHVSKPVVRQRCLESANPFQNLPRSLSHKKTLKSVTYDKLGKIKSGNVRRSRAITRHKSLYLATTRYKCAHCDGIMDDVISESGSDNMHCHECYVTPMDKETHNLSLQWLRINVREANCKFKHNGACLSVYIPRAHEEKEEEDCVKIMDLLRSSGSDLYKNIGDYLYEINITMNKVQNENDYVLLFDATDVCERIGIAMVGDVLKEFVIKRSFRMIRDFMENGSKIVMVNALKLKELLCLEDLKMYQDIGYLLFEYQVSADDIKSVDDIEIFLLESDIKKIFSEKKNKQTVFQNILNIVQQ